MEVDTPSSLESRRSPVHANLGNLKLKTAFFPREIFSFSCVLSISVVRRALLGSSSCSEKVALCTRTSACPFLGESAGETSSSISYSIFGWVGDLVFQFVVKKLEMAMIAKNQHCWFFFTIIFANEWAASFILIPKPNIFRSNVCRRKFEFPQQAHDVSTLQYNNKLQEEGCSNVLESKFWYGQAMDRCC